MIAYCYAKVLPPLLPPFERAEGAMSPFSGVAVRRIARLPTPRCEPGHNYLTVSNGAFQQLLKPDLLNKKRFCE